MLVNKLTNINMSKYANLFKNSLKIDNFLTKEISPFRFISVDITTKKDPSTSLRVTRLKRNSYIKNVILSVAIAKSKNLNLMSPRA